MQTLNTPHGTYTLKPERDAGEFLAKLAKCAGKTKRATLRGDGRNYPAFTPGMSTAEYVQAWRTLNDGARMIERGFFAELNAEPCALYKEDDQHEDAALNVPRTLADGRQLMSTERGRYVLAPGRDAGALALKLAKCTGAYKPAKIAPEQRGYPQFAKDMSTRDYVAAFYGINGIEPAGYLAPLNADTCTVYTGADLFEEAAEDLAPAAIEPAPVPVVDLAPIDKATRRAMEVARTLADDVKAAGANTPEAFRREAARVERTAAAASDTWLGESYRLTAQMLRNYADSLRADDPAPARGIVADHRIAHAAGTDAGNRSMRAAGRAAWDAEDWDIAAATMARVLGLPVETPPPIRGGKTTHASVPDVAWRSVPSAASVPQQQRARVHARPPARARAAPAHTTPSAARARPPAWLGARWRSAAARPPRRPSTPATVEIWRPPGTVEIRQSPAAVEIRGPPCSNWSTIAR
jgi:hypothetical protein